MQEKTFPNWMPKALRWAAVYNVVWGTWVVLLPFQSFDWMGMARPVYPAIWQAVGMIVACYGLAYWIASYNPFQHWGIVLVGFLGKIFGPIGFIQHLYEGKLPLIFGLHNITNDVIWWLPFGLILYGAFRYNQDTSRDNPAPLPWQEAIKYSRTNLGKTLEMLNQEHPVMLVFLRHFGCTFCREALADLAKKASKMEEKGQKLVLVHLAHEERAHEYFRKYGLENVEFITDPQARLYESFELGRARFGQAFGWKAFVRGFNAGIWKGFGVGKNVGDGFRMPGVFIIYQNRILEAYRHQSVADRPDYEQLAQCPLPKRENAGS